MSDKSKTTLFIGNGYDVAYGFKTSYTDFLSSKNFDYQVNSGNKLCAFIKEQQKKGDWVDIEICLYDYSKTISPGDVTRIKNFKSDYSILCKAIISYLKTAVQGISNERLRNLQREWCANYPNMDVISFNYTPMLDSNLRILGFKGTTKYVHGTISYDDDDVSDSIVLGIDGTMKVEEPFSFLYKAANSNINIRNIKQIINSSNNYIIYGCSMGITDRWYFKDIFTSKDKNVTLYYYGQENKTKIINRIIDLSNDSLADFKSLNTLNILDSKKI
jgi:hypothetical protein